MKIAIVHDWLVRMRGGEKVLEIICELFPEADLYTLIYEKGNFPSIIEDRRIYTSFLQKSSFTRKNYRHLLPMLPFIIESFDLKNYDIIISTSHCVAKGIRKRKDQLHVSYIHTPMRYMWDRFDDYFGKDRSDTIVRIAAMMVRPWLQNWDVKSSQRVDHIISNSQFVSERIKNYYHRESTVIYPPVNVGEFHPLNYSKKNYYLTGGGLVPYKNFDLIIKAFNQLDRELTIFGDGPEINKLKNLAKSNIKFIGRVSDNELKKLLSEAKAFLFAAVEDFGITLVESLAAGTPVIAYGKGGATEIIKDGENGILFYQRTPEAIIEAVKKSESIDWQSKKNYDTIEKFDRDKFKTQIMTYIQEKILQWKKERNNL